MINNRPTANDTRNILRRAIQSGVYHAGDSLPSSRDLAQQFGINRNTANKIYQELALEGLVEAVPNRPPKVIAPARGSTTMNLREHIRSSIWPLIHEVRILGVPETSMRETILQAVDDFFRTFTPPRILVTECNDADVERYARELTAVLGCVVEPVLLDQLSAVVNRADIIVTPHFHFAEARSALGDAGDLALSVLLTPDAADISRVVSRVKDGPVGLVGGNQASVERLHSLLKFYMDLPVITAIADDADAITQLIKNAQHIVCTARFRDWLDSLGAGGKTLPMHYHVDPISIEMLRQHIVAPHNPEPLATDGYSGSSHVGAESPRNMPVTDNEA